MSAYFDLIILPLVRSGGQDRPEVPGLFVAAPPRRTARYRDRDHLALFLALVGNYPLASNQLDDLLTRLADTYYRTSGSVTIAQRAVVEALNEYLLNRNLRSASDNQSAMGMLTQVVLREGRLYLAQSGPMHAFLLSPDGAEHLYDTHLAGDGLGLSHTASVRFSQSGLHPGDALVLTPQNPPPWSIDSIQSVQGQGPESQRRRLLSQAGPEINAVLFGAQPGSGLLRLLRPVRVMRPRPAPPAIEPGGTESVEVESPQAVPGMAVEEPTAVIPDIESSLAKDQGVLLVEETPGSLAEDANPALIIPAVLAASTQPAVTEPATAAISPPGPPPPAKSTPGSQPSSMSRLQSSAGDALHQVSQTTGTFLRRVLPDESIFTIPSTVMAGIAIAVPLVVVAITSLVYFQRGRAAQYDLYFAQASAAAAHAEAQTDPAQQRQAWETTLGYLDQAESFQTTEQSAAIRNQAFGVLDGLDVVDRLDYRPAIVGGMDETISVSRMVPVNTDLYLLDENSGVVKRGVFTNRGYQLDPTFECGPGAHGGLIVGAIKDIAPLPKSDISTATIAGLDANGNLLYCQPGEPPSARSLQPPDINWGSPTGFTIDSNDLYVLDPQTNAVWIYRDMDVASPPRLFFGENIPPMQDVIDLAVNQNDLYLLHADNHVTTCAFSALIESPTRCEDQAVFSDPRPGRQSGPLVEGATFSQIDFSPPPDPSLYLLDPIQQAIYNFSVRLTYDRQFRSLNSLPDAPATAFAVDKDNRSIFLAIGNQVYYAALP
jgi:hypothetical protein